MLTFCAVNFHTSSWFYITVPCQNHGNISRQFCKFEFFFSWIRNSSIVYGYLPSSIGISRSQISFSLASLRFAKQQCIAHCQIINWRKQLFKYNSYILNIQITDKYRITAVMDIETDIIACIAVTVRGVARVKLCIHTK